MSSSNQRFTRFARKSALVMGSPKTFTFTLFLIAVWAASGPFLKFSENWQLIANTTTTLLTTLMVLLVQNTQNRDSLAIQLKLNELLRVQKEARNITIGLEECEGKEAEELQQEFKKMRDE